MRRNVPEKDMRFPSLLLAMSVRGWYSDGLDHMKGCLAYLVAGA